MRRRSLAVAVAGIALIATSTAGGAAPEPQGPPPADECGLGSPCDCRIAGSGSTPSTPPANVDTWSFHASPHRRTGHIRGSVTHTTAAGDILEGEVTFLICRADGGGGPGRPTGGGNLSDWGGVGRWNSVPGHEFRVHAEDRGEPGDDDFYTITITDSDGSRVYFAGGGLVDGNVQILPLRP